MRTLTLAAALTLTSTLALAQVPTLTLTYGKVQELSAGLATLDRSYDSCDVGPAKPGAPVTKPCPSTATVIQMARDMRALEEPMKAFNAARDKLLKEVKADLKLKVGKCVDPTPPPPPAQLSADCQATQGRQVAAFQPLIEELLATPVELYTTQPFTAAQLDLEHNHLSATTLLQLAPLIPEVLPPQPKPAKK